MQNYLKTNTNYQRKQTRTENPRKQKVKRNQTSTSVNNKNQENVHSSKQDNRKISTCFSYYFYVSDFFVHFHTQISVGFTRFSLCSANCSPHTPTHPTFVSLFTLLKKNIKFSLAPSLIKKKKKQPKSTKSKKIRKEWFYSEFLKHKKYILRF